MSSTGEKNWGIFKSIFVPEGTLYFPISAGFGNVNGAGFVKLVNLGP